MHKKIYINLNPCKLDDIYTHSEVICFTLINIGG